MTTSCVLAVDPSVRSPGAALFYNNDLMIAERVRPPAGADWLSAGTSVFSWFRRRSICGATEFVFEYPQIYTWSKSKGDPNDLIGLAATGAFIAGLLLPERVRTPTPAEWIGQLSKVCPVCKGKAKKQCRTCEGSAFKTPRGQRIMSRLTPKEKLLVPDQNDAVDAVGLGLWALGRLEPRHVYSTGVDP